MRAIWTLLCHMLYSIIAFTVTILFCVGKNNNPVNENEHSSTNSASRSASGHVPDESSVSTEEGDKTDDRSSAGGNTSSSDKKKKKKKNGSKESLRSAAGANKPPPSKGGTRVKNSKDTTKLPPPKKTTSNISAGRVATCKENSTDDGEKKGQKGKAPPASKPKQTITKKKDSQNKAAAMAAAAAANAAKKAGPAPTPAGSKPTVIRKQESLPVAKPITSDDLIMILKRESDAAKMMKEKARKKEEERKKQEDEQKKKDEEEEKKKKAEAEARMKDSTKGPKKRVSSDRREHDDLPAALPILDPPAPNGGLPPIQKQEPGMLDADYFSLTPPAPKPQIAGYSPSGELVRGVPPPPPETPNINYQKEHTIFNPVVDQSRKDVRQAEIEKLPAVFEQAKDTIRVNMNQIYWKNDQTALTITITNAGQARRAFKMRCSDVKTFHINPVFGMLNVGENAQIQIKRLILLTRTELVEVESVQSGGATTPQEAFAKPTDKQFTRIENTMVK